MDYFRIDTSPDEDMSFCILDDCPEGTFLIRFKMARGLPAAPEYPGTPAWRMTKTYPGIKLPSLIANTPGLLIVKRDLKDALVATKAPLEALPFKLLNHKGRIASEDYFIVNPLGTIDCLDLERSEIEYEDDQVVSVDKLVLAPKKLEGVPEIFRVKQDPYAILLSHALVTRLKRLKPTNVYLEKMEQ